MSRRGDWGDKIIITLHSNDARRNKHWCVNYKQSDKSCFETVTKCTGSAHCPYYRQMADVGPVEPGSVPDHVPIIKLDEPKPSTVQTEPVRVYIPGHNPAFGEKLLGKVVLIKDRITGRFTIGEIVSENHDSITVERDNSSTIKYSRKHVISQKNFWVLD